MYVGREGFAETRADDGGKVWLVGETCENRFERGEFGVSVGEGGCSEVCVCVAGVSVGYEFAEELCEEMDLRLLVLVLL